MIRKFFALCMLLCVAIAFTGCGGNSNSSENLTTIIKVQVPTSLVSDWAVTRASVASNSTLLTINGVEFNNFIYANSNRDVLIFSKVVYANYQDGEASKLKKPFMDLVFKYNGVSTSNIYFDGYNALPQSIVIVKNNGQYLVGYNNEVPSIVVSDVKPVEITSVQLKKIDDKSATVTLLNGSEPVVFDWDSWKIIVKKGDNSEAFTDADENICFEVTKNETNYTVKLTPYGEAQAAGHLLTNVTVTIEAIRDEARRLVVTSKTPGAVVNF